MLFGFWDECFHIFLLELKYILFEKLVGQLFWSWFERRARHVFDCDVELDGVIDDAVARTAADVALEVEFLKRRQVDFGGDWLLGYHGLNSNCSWTGSSLVGLICSGRGS